MNKRFKVTKIGLLNFWLYDEEEYDFYGGKLILRGTNGSGKSVTMQSFIPLILDGNKSPDRLDPFGSKERKIEDYIIGDSESIQKEDATAYLYMETLNEENNQYITIGLGFRGRKGKPVESWGFALKDGSRIGKDFYLYKDKSNKIPLSKNELKARLGTVNEFTDTTKDYKAMVNRLLFGFPNLDLYDEFIKLLLQLRSNKLSKDYKPTNLVNVLNTVLQPLTEEDLRPLSEAIEQMNKTKEQVETLEKNSKSVKDFLKVYQNYNEIVLLNKAKNYQTKFQYYKQLKEKLETITNQIKNYEKNLEESNNRYNNVQTEIEINSEAKRKLDNQDLKQKIEELTTIEKNIKELNLKLEELSTNIENNEKIKLDLNKKQANIEDESYRIKKSINELCIDLKGEKEESYFDELTYFVTDLEEKIDTIYSFDSILMSLKRHIERLTTIKNLLEQEEKILLDSESLKEEFEKLQKEYKTLEQTIETQEKNLKEQILSWQEEFINKVNNFKYLKLQDNTKKQIFTLMNNYSSSSYEQVKNIYNETCQTIKNKIIEDNLLITNKQNSLKEKLMELDTEKIKLIKQVDFVIESNTIEVDKYLLENKIDYLPLYKCLEFKDNIDEKAKDSIESSLLELNILNAKIINPADLEKIENLKEKIAYLTPTTEKKNNILKFFDVTIPNDSTIKKDYVEKILSSISMDQNDIVSLTETGLSKLDFLRYISDKNYHQTYIGYLKRKEIKQRKIEELNEKIDILTKEIDNLNTIITENQNKISVLENEAKLLPTNEVINSIIDEINKLNISLEWNDNKQKKLEEKLKEINKELYTIKEKITSNKSGLEIPLNVTSYKEALLVTSSIKEQLLELKTIHQNYLSKLEIRASYQINLENILETLDYLNSDYEEKQKNLKVNLSNKETITNLLNTKEYKDQKEQLLKIETELAKLFEEEKMLIEKNAKLKSDISYNTDEYDELLKQFVEEEKYLKAYEEIFLREYKLGYVYQEEITDINKTINSIIKANKERKEISINDALNKFYSSYNHYNLELNDYSLKNITLFADYENKELKEIYENNTRADITAMYQGIKINIIDLDKKLTMDIEENKDLISKQDRYLFEEILLNTVGEKIRNRIKSSEEWVSKINNIMAKMQEDSALSFKLVWKSISATSEDEIDTKELVKILRMDPKLLKDADAEKLTNHFRSKIKKAEELYQDSYISFYKIVEDILDYRSWFTFQLLYQRKGMERKELTDKTFSKFSGGERAKSMYIPLFASVYAKFNLAREDALRIIALDEAFAGVDEDNIREMFGILKYLDIDFIINSQVLWGDYDTIEELSICELIRPQNSQVVTVERYRWNGKYKEIITNREEYLEEKSDELILGDVNA